MLWLKCFWNQFSVTIRVNYANWCHHEQLIICIEDHCAAISSFSALSGFKTFEEVINDCPFHGIKARLVLM
jgi:hypothetical protein